MSDDDVVVDEHDPIAVDWDADIPVPIDVQIANDVFDCINESMTGSARTQQAQARKLGVSDIGHCREYARRMIMDIPFTNVQNDYVQAWLGTVIGKDLEERFAAKFGGLNEAEVTVTLPILGYILEIPGHVDYYRRDLLVDFKSRDGVGAVRNTGPSDKERFQTTLYAKALIAAGLLDEDATLALVYIDRSGRERRPHVEAWTYDPSIVDEASAWLEDVIYAVQNDEVAAKDKPRTWCAAVCEYYDDCRGRDTDVEGLIEDPIIVDAVRVYREAKAKMSQLDKDAKSAASLLEHVEGVVGDVQVRHTVVNASDVPGYTRRQYTKLDIRPVPKGRSRSRQSWVASPPSTEGA